MERDIHGDRDISDFYNERCASLKYNYSLGFLNEFISDGEFEGLEKDAYRLKDKFFNWKTEFYNSPLSPSSELVDLHKDAIDQMDYYSLSDCAEKEYKYWDAVCMGMEVDNPGEDNSIEVRNYHSWQYAHDVVVEVIDIENEKKNIVSITEEHLRGENVPVVSTRSEYNTENETKQLIEEGRFVGKFMSSAFAKIDKMPAAKSEIEKANFIADEFDMFQNSEIVRLQKNNTDKSKKTIPLIKGLSLGKIARNIGEIIGSLNLKIEMNNEEEDVRDLEKWLDRQHLLMLAQVLPNTDLEL